MVEPSHAVKAKEKCEVKGCSEAAERSLSATKVEQAGLDLSESTGKRAALCKKHYKEFKKKTKKDRELESLGW